jgi:hypothetical protein
MNSQDDKPSSFKKSGKMVGLQKIISDGLEGSDLTGFEAIQKHMKAKEKALDKYWFCCAANESVAAVLSKYNLSRRQLKDMYIKLIEVGLGQWANGHFVALSTFAYGEPFHYLMKSKERGWREGESFKEVAYDILRYFREEIPQGELYKKYESGDSSSKEQEGSYPFCGYCGRKNKSDFMFCADCGKPLEALGEGKPETATEKRPKGNEELPEIKREINSLHEKLDHLVEEKSYSQKNEDYTEDDMEDYFRVAIGPRNTDYYLEQFLGYHANKTFNFSWNFAALFMNGGWYLYRGIGLGFFATWMGATLMTVVEKFFDEARVVPEGDWIVAGGWIIWACLFAAKANKFYYSKTLRLIKKSKKKFKRKNERLDYLEKFGGVISWLPWVLIIPIAVLIIVATIHK